MSFAITTTKEPSNTFLHWHTESSKASLLVKHINFKFKFAHEVCTRTKIFQVADYGGLGQAQQLTFIETFFKRGKTIVLYETGPFLDKNCVQQSLVSELRERFIRKESWDIIEELLNKSTLEELETEISIIQKKIAEHSLLKDPFEKEVNKNIAERNRLIALIGLKDLQLQLNAAREKFLKLKADPSDSEALKSQETIVANLEELFMSKTSDFRLEAMEKSIELALKVYEQVIVLSGLNFANPELGGALKMVPRVVLWAYPPTKE